MDGRAFHLVTVKVFINVFRLQTFNRINEIFSSPPQCSRLKREFEFFNSSRQVITRRVILGNLLRGVVFYVVTC